jgi:hypothetical protein
MVSALWVKFREGIVEEEEWRTTCAVREEFNFCEEEGEQEAALLTARGNGCQVAPAGVKGKIVSVWPDQRIPLIPFTLRGFIKGLA